MANRRHKTNRYYFHRLQNVEAERLIYFYIKFIRWISSTPEDSPVQLQSDWSTFDISIAALILKRLEINCLETAGAPHGGTEKSLQDPFPRTAVDTCLRPASAAPQWKHTTRKHWASSTGVRFVIIFLCVQF